MTGDPHDRLTQEPPHPPRPTPPPAPPTPEPEEDLSPDEAADREVDPE